MITFLVPTFNEKLNINMFISTIRNLKLKYKYNILFVDDNSQDGTIEELKKAKNKFSNVDYLIRIEKNRDLTKSLVLAMSRLKEKYTLVMDCDLQHDYKKIEIFIDSIVKYDFDLVIGSRFVKDGQNIVMNKRRILESKLGILLCKFLGIKDIADPLSGFFIIKSEFLLNVKDKIKTRGFKILLTILYLYKNKIKLNEVPIKFNRRMYEKSKLNLKIKIYFIEQIIRLKLNF